MHNYCLDTKQYKAGNRSIFCAVQSSLCNSQAAASNHVLLEGTAKISQRNTACTQNLVNHSYRHDTTFCHACHLLIAGHQQHKPRSKRIASCSIPTSLLPTAPILLAYDWGKRHDGGNQLLFMHEDIRIWTLARSEFWESKCE